MSPTLNWNAMLQCLRSLSQGTFLFNSIQFLSPFFLSAYYLNLNRTQTYVFKLMNSSGVSESGESEKVLLLMESGVRLHTTLYMRYSFIISFPTIFFLLFINK